MKLAQKTTDELKQEWERLFEALHKESDRGSALVAGAFLDLTLETLLRARFSSRVKGRAKLLEPLFEGFGPLSTFSSKIRISYAIDLLQDWVASDLDVIRSIRNEFAHNLELTSFRDPRIIALVGRLLGYDRSEQILREQGLTRKGHIPPHFLNRHKFELVCSVIGTSLQTKIVVLGSAAPEAMKREFMVNPEL